MNDGSTDLKKFNNIKNTFRCPLKYVQ